VVVILFVTGKWQAAGCVHWLMPAGEALHNFHQIVEDTADVGLHTKRYHLYTSKDIFVNKKYKMFH